MRQIALLGLSILFAAPNVLGTIKALLLTNRE